MPDERILVIDDEAAVCDVVALILEDAGYIVDKATGGIEALVSIKRRLPNLVVLDLMMPDISGWDVYQTLRATKRTRDIPVIVVSADRDVLAKARALGAAAHISKPFQMDELVRAVRDNVRRSVNRKRLDHRLCRGVA